MAICISAKAIIVCRGKILLNHCVYSTGQAYDDLPGGGQYDFEPIEDAVVREVLEEPGLDIHVERLPAYGEEISGNNERQEKFPEYAHRSEVVFLVRLCSDTVRPVTEMDLGQLRRIWLADMLPVQSDCNTEF